MSTIYILPSKTDAYGFVKQIAAEKYNIVATCLEIKKGTHGKPYFDNLPDFHFNLSNSGKLLVLAISDTAVGIDAEKVRTPDYRVLKRFCEDERVYIADSPTRFFEVWTRKEAYLKYLGTGLSGGLDSFSIFKTDKLLKTFTIDDYIISICGDDDFEIIDLR